jgi:hypothetical protein
MEIATRLNEPTVADGGFDAKTADIDLGSIGECIEAALAQVTFTASEIEGVLALDDPCWHSIGTIGLEQPKAQTDGVFPDSGRLTRS